MDKKMNISEIYSKRILLSENVKRKPINFSSSKKAKLFFIVYTIENYFRPKVIQKLELILLKVGLMKNPSIGPYQIKYSTLKTSDLSDSNLLRLSLLFLEKEMKRFNLFKNPSRENFIQFGRAYNGTSHYGEVMFQLYRSFLETSSFQS